MAAGIEWTTQELTHYWSDAQGWVPRNDSTVSNNFVHYNPPQPAPCQTCHRCPTCGSYGPSVTYPVTWKYFPNTVAAPQIPIGTWPNTSTLTTFTGTLDTSKLQATAYNTNQTVDEAFAAVKARLAGSAEPLECPSGEECSHD